MKKKSGFTILELAVTVIIIAVIAVVALPMYKHAILKSRFSTVMPMAKAVADAQEIYYLGNNQYALGKEDLDIAPVEAENTQVSLSPAEEDEEYIYVAAHRTDIPNVRYIMYQKNSPKFASNIHCEADANDEDALWLCEKALHGTEVTGSLQGKQYKTFLLAGDLGGSSFKVCPENAVCNDEGNVTGCESGYYQEEQTCKQEKACDESKKTIRTACAEDCGEEVKEGTCNVKTGQWENYTVTQSCPTKPPLTKACSELGKGWTSGTATREVKCEGNAWTEPAWNEEDCKKECDPTKEIIRTSCAEDCGEEVKQGTCNVKTGEWENYTVTQECPVKPDTEEPCEEGSDSMKTRIVSCDPTTKKWVVQGDWDTSKCKKECDPEKEPKASQTCDEYYDTTDQWCGMVTQNVECDYTTGEWVTSNVQLNCNQREHADGDTQTCDVYNGTKKTYCGTKTLSSASCNNTKAQWTYNWTGACDKKEELTQACPAGSINSSANATRTATCKKAQAKWTYSSWDKSACSVCSASQSGACGNMTFANGEKCFPSVRLISDVCMGNRYLGGSSCYVSEGMYNVPACGNGTYEDYSTCHAYGAGTCENSVFKGGSSCNGTHGGCSSSTFYDTALCNGTCNDSHFYGTSRCDSSCGSGSFISGNCCSNSSFAGNSYCIAWSDAGCRNNTYTGNACCYSTNYGKCPTGTPKCSSASGGWDGTSYN